MPGHVLHVEIASRIRHLLPEGDEVSDALYCGALAPDMGMLPGGDRLMTDLAHYHYTGRLARALVAEAVSGVERAYAWGWLTHLLADSGLHPQINRAAGDRPWDESPTAHMQVEFGIDHHRLANVPALGGIRIGTVPGSKLVTHAYRDTYGLVVAPELVSRSHRSLAAAQRLLFRLGGNPARLATVRWIGSRFPNSIVQAATNPSSPTATLLEEVALFLRSIESRFESMVSEDLDGLPDYNLDTGQVAGESDDYPLAVAARDRLRRRLEVQRPATSGNS